MVDGGKDLYEKTLMEIGLITTTWAKFEHWIDQAIWLLSGADKRKGACITTQIGSIHGKFRSLIGLMAESNRPEEAMKVARKMSEKAAQVVQIRTRFAHGPLDMGLNLDEKKFEVYLRKVNLQGKVLQFETNVLTEDELKKAKEAVASLYADLLQHWSLIVGVSSPDALAPEHN